MLIGNAGANVLNGKLGSDTLIGGVGNDFYEVDSGNDDLVTEHAGEGTDQVNSSATYALGAFVENLNLTGTANSNGIGNVLANAITGNAGENVLEGLEGNDTLTGNGGRDILDGGSGADSLVGGSGNDEYILDSAADKVAEKGPASDLDTVNSTFTYTLGANLEQLWLSGSDAIEGTGNSLNNSLVGNDNANATNCRHASLAAPLQLAPTTCWPKGTNTHQPMAAWLAVESHDVVFSQAQAVRSSQPGFPGVAGRAQWPEPVASE